MNSFQGKILIFIHGFVHLIFTLVKPRVWFDFVFFCSILLFVDELLQVSISDQLVLEYLKGSVVLCLMSPIVMVEALPSLVASFEVSPHRFGFLEIQFIPDPSQEFVDRFFENHIDNPVLLGS